VRSTCFPADAAKMTSAPMFHVNGDDPEAAVHVIGLALEFRQKMAQDVMVDMICYRRHGRNEGDEPSFTNPNLHALIRRHLKPILADKRQRLVQARQQAALPTIFNEVGMGRGARPAQTHRGDLREPLRGAPGTDVFSVRACCQALQELPRVNARIEG
jgi:hypothetical protein